MLLPVRCFTCNRLLADEKLTIFEKLRYEKFEKVKDFFEETLKIILKTHDAKLLTESDNEIVLYPNELKEQYKFKIYHQNSSTSSGSGSGSAESSLAGASEGQIHQYNSENYFTVSPSSDWLLLNLLGVENYCCRRMFLSYINMIENIN
jgi:DNA-directed RNA polymerase subunit N (RpoN/RPB10)